MSAVSPATGGDPLAAFRHAEIGPVRLLRGDAVQVLAVMPPASVDCMVTSPPYWGLRDYAPAGRGQSGVVQYGLECSVGEYIERLVAVFAQVRRVLKPTGTAWLNLGVRHEAPHNRMEVQGLHRRPVAAGR